MSDSKRAQQDRARSMHPFSQPMVNGKNLYLNDGIDAGRKLWEEKWALEEEERAAEADKLMNGDPDEVIEIAGVQGKRRSLQQFAERLVQPSLVVIDELGPNGEGSMDAVWAAVRGYQR